MSTADLEKLLDSYDNMPVKIAGTRNDCKMVCNSKNECQMVCGADCSGGCTPLYIYIALVILQLITILTMKIYDPNTKSYVPASVAVKASSAVMTVVIGGLVGWVMYYLCKNCHSGWSWAILLLPLVLNILLLVFSAGYLVAKRSEQSPPQSPM